MAAKKKTAKKKAEAMSPEEYTARYLMGNKDYHYNYEEDLGEEKISTGSLLLDTYMSGGISGGCHTFCGANGGGKTSEALEIMNQKIKAGKKSGRKVRGIYIKAEGRLSQGMKDRSGITFTTDPENWDDGTCFVFESNVFETVTDYLLGLIKNNPDGVQFVIVIDSMHGLIPKGDLDRPSSEANKVAGGALLASNFLRKCSIPISKRGHICIMMLQVRATIAASAYAKADPNNQTSSSSSNAGLHFSDWILEFRKPLKGDLIMAKGEDTQVTPTNPAIGHYARLMIAKADNDNRMMEVKYPIKHNRTGGKSIWIEREIIDLLLSWEFIEKKGSWFTFDEELTEILKNAGQDKNSVQGLTKLYGLLEEDEKICDLLREFVQENILNEVR